MEVNNQVVAVDAFWVAKSTSQLPEKIFLNGVYATLAADQ
jgi:hypothetical protein